MVLKCRQPSIFNLRAMKLTILFLWMLFNVVNISLCTNVDDDFAEFSDPDDTSTLDITDSMSDYHAKKSAEEARKTEAAKRTAEASSTNNQNDDFDNELSTLSEDVDADFVEIDSPEKASSLHNQPDKTYEKSTGAHESQTASSVTEEQESSDDMGTNDWQDGIIHEDDEEFEGFSEASAKHRRTKQHQAQHKTSGYKNQGEPMDTATKGKLDTTTGGNSKSADKPDLKIVKVPHHLTRSWDNYQLEMLIIVGLLIYFANFIYGKSQNTRLATAWFESHQSLLDANFALVGDDGSVQAGQRRNENENDNVSKSDSPDDSSFGGSTSLTGCPGFMKDSENVFSLWCSGRVFIDGMLIELRLVKRQCIGGMLLHWLKPGYDSVVAKVVLDEGEMEGFVWAMGRRRRLHSLQKEHQDLATFCPPAPTGALTSGGSGMGGDRGSVTTLGSLGISGGGSYADSNGVVEHAGSMGSASTDSFCVISEFPEVTNVLINPTVIKLLENYQDNIDYMYFSDQYTGPKQSQDEQTTPKPSVPAQKALIFSFRFGNRGTVTLEDMNKSELFQFVFLMIERARRVRLTKDAKARSERSRTRANDTKLKQLLHTQRQEMAQNRKDEKRRAAKERIMAEEDPEKARRLEERERKKDKKSGGPRMKMMKVKGM